MSKPKPCELCGHIPWSHARLFNLEGHQHLCDKKHNDYVGCHATTWIKENEFGHSVDWEECKCKVVFRDE